MAYAFGEAGAFGTLGVGLGADDGVGMGLGPGAGPGPGPGLVPRSDGDGAGAGAVEGGESTCGVAVLATATGGGDERGVDSATKR